MLYERQNNAFFEEIYGFYSLFYHVEKAKTTDYQPINNIALFFNISNHI